MRTMIGIPSRGNIKASMLRGLSNLIMQASTNDIYINKADNIESAREILATTAINKRYDYLLFIDDDVVSFSQFDFVNLFTHMQDKNASIISGVYFTKSPKALPVIYDNVERFSNGAFFSNAAYNKADVFKIQACGMGFCLIKVSLLEQVLNEYGTMFSLLPHLGEDFSFCERVRRLGVDIYADSNILLGHEGFDGRVFTYRDYARN